MVERLGVRLLGEFRLDGVDLDALRSRKARTVLKRLALEEGGVVSADAMIEAVWPVTTPADPTRDLHVLVSRARAVVGSDRIERRDGGYALNGDWWDRADLVALTREAGRRRDAGDLTGARTASEAAIALVRGRLMQDEPDAQWLDAARATTATVVAEARQIAAAAALAHGRIGDAAAHARAALEHDPYDEVALRTLMRAHLAGGQPATALTEYAKARERLADELGVHPSAETQALHVEILRAETPAPLTPLDPVVRLVGRDLELRLLDDALEQSRAGARLVLVTGEAGVGKTALLEHWAATARARGVVVLSGRAEEQSLTLQPVLDALAGHLGSGELAELRTPDESGLPLPEAGQEALSLRLFTALDELVGALAGDRGLGLLIDDADTADPVTLGWLAHVRRRAADHRYLLVLAARDEAALATEGLTILRVPPLDLAAVTELVGADRATDLFERGGGNPLLITELASATDAEDLPATLRDAVAKRLRRTGATATTLQTAAVVGATVDLDLVTGILGMPPLQVLDHLDVGVRQSFLIEHLGTLAFRHELVRAAVAADAGAARRAWIHREAARILHDRPDANPIELARQAREGGDRPLAAEGLAHAADIARARLDLPGAERFLDEALTLQDTAALRLSRSRVRMARGDVDGADADAEAALATDDTGEALELRAWAARHRHDMPAAIRLGQTAAKVATDPTIRASSLIAVAFAHRGLGDLQEAESVLEEAAVPAAPADLGLPAWVGVLRVHQGRPLEALSDLEPRLGADARLGMQGYWVEHTLQMTAHAYGLLGRSADAHRVLDRIEEELERRGTWVRYAGMAHTYRSWLLRNLGVPGAEELAESGRELARGQEVRAQCGLDIADCLLRAGALGAAGEALERAKRESGAQWFHNRWRFDQRLGLVAARLRLADRDAEAAVDLADGVAAAADERGDRRYGVLARLVAVTALGRLGRSHDTEQLDHDLALLPEVGALEGWWLAADVADATGSAQAADAASRLAGQVADGAGEHAERFRRSVASRLG